ncbi:MAG: hypothetical protein K2N18_03960 [Clostridia bacterium]|nr:hypothetical protein [Clostridia bacterium]
MFCLAVIIPLVIGCLILGGVNGFTVQSALDNGDGASVAEAAAAVTDTWSTGYPTGKKYSYTDITTGITMSGYAPTHANFGSGMSDRIEVTVANPSNAATGTQTNPYVISTQADWQSFVTYIKSKSAAGTNQYGKGQYFVLNANLDYANAQIPSLPNFYGTFYGTNHVISNAKIGYDTAVNQAYTAAIFQTTSNAYISDLNVYSYTMTTTKIHSAPIVANASANTVIANCSTIGSISATSFDSASVSASSGNYAASPAFGGIAAHVNSTNVKIYKCSAKITITINTTYNSRDWFYGGILGGLLNNSSTAYIYDCYSSMNVNSVMGSSSSYFCVSGIVGYAAAGSAYVRNCICIFDAVVTGGTQFAAALGSGNHAGFTNCYSFYTFGNKARSNGAITRYKLGTGRDSTVNSSNCYAYSSSYTKSDSDSAKLNLQDASSVSDLWTRAKNVLNPDIWLHQYLADNNDTANPIDISVKPVHLNSAKITFRYADDSVINLKDSSGNDIDNPIEYSLSESDITDLPTIPAPTAGGTLEANRMFAGWTTDKDSADSKVYKKYSRDMIGNVDMYPVWEITDFDTNITGTTQAASNIKNAATITYTNDKDNNVVLTANATTNCTLDSGHRTYAWYKDGSTTPIANETGSTLTLKNVAQSGKYTVKVTAVGKDEVLWRGEATSDEYTVTINRGSLNLKSDWAIDGKAFVGEKYSDIKFKATAIDAVTNTKVDGEFTWSYPVHER